MVVSRYVDELFLVTKGHFCYNIKEKYKSRKICMYYDLNQVRTYKQEIGRKYV